MPNFFRRVQPLAAAVATLATPAMLLFAGQRIGAQTPSTGRVVLARMHDAYAGKWYSTLRFVQKTTRYGADGTPT